MDDDGEAIKKLKQKTSIEKKYEELQLKWEVDCDEVSYQALC